MQHSQFSTLKKPNRIVLAAGHGGGDSGETYNGYNEANETVALTDAIKSHLETKGLEVYLVPHSLGLKEEIRHVNNKFDYGQAWAIEIHRDSADSIKEPRASKECGVYHGTSQDSTAIGRFIRQVYLREGADPTSWARSHTQSRFGKLGWIADTTPLAHLMELGFMQGSHTATHFKWLAKTASVAIYEAFTSESYYLKPAPGDITPQALMSSLAHTYAETDLKLLFSRLKIRGVNVAHHTTLKESSLAQWILESGWATSRLALEHYNFGGLKWRDEMEGYATPVSYVAHDGRDIYCHFDSIPAFITGYWQFLTRAPYQGWANYTNSAEAFIGFLLHSGYTTGQEYDDDVLALVPKAESLLSESATA